MADYASMIGGTPNETMDGASIPLDADAYYRIEAEDVFVDRFDSTGDSQVDARGNPDAIRVELGSGTDTVSAGSGDDIVWAGAGNDELSGGDGRNTVSGGSGDDAIGSGGGNDSLLGGSGADTILAGLGDDYVAGGGEADLLQGEGGNDTLLGGSGDDTLSGGEGADSLAGGSGSDLLLGDAGDDTLLGGSGGDVFSFDSGFGQDVITDFSLAGGDRINLASNLSNSGITDAQQLVDRGLVTGGTSPSGTPFTVITVGGNTIRLENVDYLEFSDQIATLVKVG